MDVQLLVVILFCFKTVDCRTSRNVTLVQTHEKGTQTCMPIPPTEDTWSKETYPNPQYDVDRCGNNCSRSRLCDPGNLLTSHQASEIDHLLDRRLGRKCACAQCERYPYPIFLAILPKLNLQPWTEETVESKQQEATDFADYLQWNWFRGSVCHDATVLVVFWNDTVVGISTGNSVSDTTCIAKSRDKTLHRLQEKNNAFEVLIDFVDEVRSALQMKSCKDAEPNRWYVAVIFTLVVIAILASLGTLWFNGRCCKKGEDTSEMWKRRRPSYRPWTPNNKDDDESEETDEDDEDDETKIAKKDKGEDGEEEPKLDNNNKSVKTNKKDDETAGEDDVFV